ncbi:MAG TPA: DUF559 domain-containing protein [Sphingobium sp.]
MTEALPSPLPPAGGAGGGQGTFLERDTDRAKSLRNNATLPERRLWQRIRNRQLGHKFSRQIPLGPYFCDFLCREQKLIVELDGATHADDPAHDIRRDAYCTELGFRVLRFTNAEVMTNLDGVLEEIRAALMPTPDPSRKREGRRTE